ncbi:MAG: phosphoketolase family protein, partial [Lactobacillaceae bacterium]
IENDDIHDYTAYHKLATQVLDQAIEDIQAIQKDARENGKYQDGTIPAWPVIIARLPKGWGGPEYDENGDPIENSFRAHQVPLPLSQNDLTTLPEFEAWMNSYKPDELFNADGSVKDEIKAIAPKGNKRMSANPITNGGADRSDLKLPNWREFANDINDDTRGKEFTDSKRNMDMATLSNYLGAVSELNPTRFRFFGPDETMSNRLWGLFDKTPRQWMKNIKEPQDELLSPSGRIIDSQLSEHQAEGWLEGYTLTGRVGIFASYESFLRVVDTMITQHFKWLRQAAEQSWRNDYPSLNLIATSTAFQQDHNGYTHQDPGLLTHLAEKKSNFIREYLPADGNSLLAVQERAFSERHKVNLLIASKQPRQQWFTVEEAEVLANEGLKIIDWASTAPSGDVDITFASAGTEPTVETLAALWLINQAFPEVNFRYVNVVELLRLQKKSESNINNERELSDEEFNKFFQPETPVIFGFHAYEDLIESFFFERKFTGDVYVHGYREDGDITTTYDMRVYSHLDRFHQAKEAAEILSANGKIDQAAADTFIAKMDDTLAKHFEVTRNEGCDIEEFTDWNWSPLK